MSDTTSFSLTPELSSFIAGAFDSGNVILLAVVSETGKPVLSFRGSVSVFSDAQLSFWVRNSGGETLDAIKANMNVALVYRSPSVPVVQFIGRARVTDNASERDRAFTLAHAKEQERDPERKGVAVIVDLDEIKGATGYGKDGPIFIHLIRG